MTPHPVLRAATEYLKDNVPGLDCNYLSTSHAIVRRSATSYSLYILKHHYFIIGIQHTNRISVAKYHMPFYAEDHWERHPPITTDSDWTNYEFADPESFLQLAKYILEK